MILKDILKDRSESKVKQYIVETEEYWSIIQGNYIREATGEVLDWFEAFKRGDVEWKSVSKRINYLFNEEKEAVWKELKDYENVTIIEAYADGEKLL